MDSTRLTAVVSYPATPTIITLEHVLSPRAQLVQGLAQPRDSMNFAEHFLESFTEHVAMMILPSFLAHCPPAKLTFFLDLKHFEQLCSPPGYSFIPCCCFAGLVTLGFSSGGGFALQGNTWQCLGTFFGCHPGKWDATGISWVKARDAAKHPIMHRTIPQQRVMGSTASTVPRSGKPAARRNPLSPETLPFRKASLSIARFFLSWPPLYFLRDTLSQPKMILPACSVAGLVPVLWTRSV